MDRRLDNTLEKVISTALRAGLAVSAVLITAGFVISTFVPGPPVAGPWTLSGLFLRPFLDTVADPSSWLIAGIAALMFTPVLRILISIATFTVERDWRYVAISLCVLAIICASVAIAWRL